MRARYLPRLKNPTKTHRVVASRPGRKCHPAQGPGVSPCTPEGPRFVKGRHINPSPERAYHDDMSHFGAHHCSCGPVQGAGIVSGLVPSGLGWAYEYCGMDGWMDSGRGGLPYSPIACISLWVVFGWRWGVGRESSRRRGRSFAGE